jgi:ABC-type sugar transport system substrate-binding protein
MLFHHAIVPTSRRPAVLAVVLITSALLAGGCRRHDSGSFVVGFSQMEHNNPWRLAQTASMKEEAAKRHYELVVTDAQSQTSRQV